MRKAIVIGIVLMLAGACGPKDQRKAIEKQIASHKNEIREIKQEINTLEKQLQEDGGNTHEGNKIPVSVVTIKPDTFSHFISLNGQVEANQSAFISPEMNGQIKKIHVQEGDRVQKGQLLVSLNTRVIQNNIQEVKTNLELAKKMFEKQKDLWDQEIGSEISYLEAKNRKESLENRLETLKSQLDLSLIKAPFAGIADEIYKKEGEMGMPGMQVVNLVNLSYMKIEASISEDYLSRINKGDMVKVNFPAVPEIALDLPIRRIGNVIDPDSRTFDIEMMFKNPENKIKPNLVSEIKINDYQNNSAIVIPSIVVQQDMKGEYVFCIKNGNGSTTACKTYITTGMSYNNQTMVTAGLEPGKKVIVGGYNLVSDGLEVRIK